MLWETARTLLRYDAPEPLTLLGSALTLLTLTVEDNGTGIPAAEQTAFGRGYETPLDHSQGLGLWLVHLTVEKSGGELVIKDGDRGGAKVVVKLPEVN